MSEATCEEIRELAADVAAGIAEPGERSAALGHVAECAECRRLLAELTDAAGEMLVLVKGRDPSTGFAARALERMDLRPAAAVPLKPRSRRRRAATLVLAAALGGAVAVAGLFVATRSDRNLAARYRATLASVNGKDLKAGALVGTSTKVTGEVFAYDGNPSWVFVVLTSPPAEGSRTVVGVFKNGTTEKLGAFRLGSGRDSWGWTVSTTVEGLVRIRVVDEQGNVDSEAVLGETS
jgi:bacterioferritin-associated ferredoxin